MNPTGWIVTATALAGVGLVLWPDRQPVPTLLVMRAARARQRVRETRPATVLGPAGAATTGAVVALRWGMALGLTAMILYGVGLWAMALRSRSARRTRRTERMARLTTVLRNQASTATTVGEALTRAAPLATGSVGAAAERLARGYQEGAVADASREFIEAVPVTASVWLTDVLLASRHGSGRVANVLSTLEDLAAADADRARHFHRHVAGQMIPTITALGLAVGTVVGLAVWLPDYGQWLLSPTGQLISLIGGAVIALMCAPMFVAAAAEMRA